MVDTIELEDRIEKCEKILASDGSSQIFAALADAYRKKGDIRKAREVCLQGLKLHPGYSSARVVMAKIHMSDGNYTAAKAELEKAIESSGRSRAIDILEAEIFIRLGKITEAGTILERLYSSDPEDELVLNLMSMIGGERSPSKNGIKGEDGPAGRKRSYSLSDIVSLLKIMPRVMGVVVVTEEGLVLEGRFDGFISREEIGALSKSIFDMALAGGNKINLGPAREILIETQSSKLWIFNKDKFILTIFARDDVSMGSLKLKIEDLLSKADASIGVE
ncbi:MAG: tetratricopeptide repeat protein [Candidatus Zixiibacteriota bacterium]|nr:MAG: tetratricopeptide repeat protein [candidate division Zixibacteria bacterium]